MTGDPNGHQPTRRDDHEQKLRSAIEPHMALYDRVEQLQTENDRLREALADARTRGDHYERQFSVVSAERDRAIVQVATFKTQFRASANWFMDQARQIKEWAAEAERAPWGGETNLGRLRADAGQEDDGEPAPAFLTNGR